MFTYQKTNWWKNQLEDLVKNLTQSHVHAFERLKGCLNAAFQMHEEQSDFKVDFIGKEKNK